MTVSNQTDPLMQVNATTFGAARNTVDRVVSRAWFIPAVLAVLCILAYARYLAMPPLLDEQFLLAFSKAAGHGGVSLGSFLTWRGPDVADAWGPVATLAIKISQAALFGSPFLLRVESLLVHIAATILLFQVCRPMAPTRWLPFAAAALFGLYPLSPESVLWLGGKGSQLAGLFALASQWAYQRASWRWLLASLVLFAAALLSSASIWPLALMFTVWELFNRFVWRHEGTVRDGTLSVVAPLGFLLVTAAYVAGTGLLGQFMTSGAPDLHWKTVFQTLRACFLPINESIFSHYVRHYRFLYALMGPLLVCLVAAMVRDPKLRAFVGSSVVWLALLIQPLFGHFDARGTMYGSHLLYAAAAPIACLLAAMLFSVPSVFPRWRAPATWVSALAFCALLAFFFVHTSKQNSAYAAGGRLLAKVQKSIKIVNDRLHAPLILARDLPSSIAIMPAYSTAGMIVLDGPSGLLAASTISGGRLKDELREGRFKDVALRWDKDMQSLVPLDLGTAATSPTSLPAVEIAQRMVPGLEFYKNARLDEQMKELVLESNTTTGPAIKLRADGFTPLAPDFLCVEAKIDAPNTGIKPDIELYWTTREDPQYQNHMRRVTTPAFVGDGQYHRYFLPLRTIGWVTAGPADLLTLGFPAGARVWLRSISGADKTKVMPEFSAVAKSIDKAGTPFEPPFFRFPTEPGLPLFRVPANADSIDVSHSCENMEGASGVMIEISMPNKVFPNQNGADQSGVASSVMSIDGVKGTYGIPIAKFPVPGLYSLRAVAVNEKHHPMGNFSDDVYCLVTGKYATGWSLQP